MPIRGMYLSYRRVVVGILLIVEGTTLLSEAAFTEEIRVTTARSSIISEDSRSQNELADSTVSTKEETDWEAK